MYLAQCSISGFKSYFLKNPIKFALLVQEPLKWISKIGEADIFPKKLVWTSFFRHFIFTKRKLLKFPVRWRKFPCVNVRKIADA